LPDPPKFTQIAIFGLKIYHLATLFPCSRIVSEFATEILKSVAIFLPKTAAGGGGAG
jgi:hypothetical protein